MKEIGRYGVEAYLKKQVARSGGETRKFVSPGRPNVPDQIVIWPRVALETPRGKRIVAEIHMVETKATGKKPRRAQLREHKRLRDLGVQVFVLDTKEKVAAYLGANG